MVPYGAMFDHNQREGRPTPEEWVAGDRPGGPSKWGIEYIDGKPHLYRWIPAISGYRKRAAKQSYPSSLVMSKPGMRRCKVEYRDGNTLNNSIENIRYIPQREAQVKGKNCLSSTAYNLGLIPRGVTWHKDRWRVRLRMPDGTRIEKTFHDFVAAVDWWYEKSIYRWKKIQQLGAGARPSLEDKETD